MPLFQDLACTGGNEKMEDAHHRIRCGQILQVSGLIAAIVFPGAILNFLGCASLSSLVPGCWKLSSVITRSGLCAGTDRGPQILSFYKLIGHEPRGRRAPSG